LTPNQAHVRYSAAEYDRYTREFVKPYDEMLAAWVLRQAAGLPPDFTLLDVGTGTAQFLIHIAAFPELRSAHLVGTDVFEDMIRTAESAIGQAGLSGRIKLLLEDVHAMRLPAGFADLIVSRSTLHHWSDPVGALREVYRVLKPGGTALIVDVRRDAPEGAVREFNQFREKAGLGASFLEEKYTAPEVMAFAEKAGLKTCSSVDVGTDGLSALGLSLRIRRRRDV
jgi:ubiquinone/menaquinone biosynthesis C-methylase UbiE